MNNSFIMYITSQLLSTRPEIRNNQRAVDMLSTIQNGDAKRGEQIAQNICNAYGISREEGIRQALEFFHM